MSKTEENLREAFAGESQANRKYLAFAAKRRTRKAMRRQPGSSGLQLKPKPFMLIITFGL